MGPPAWGSAGHAAAEECDGGTGRSGVSQSRGQGRLPRLLAGLISRTSRPPSTCLVPPVGLPTGVGENPTGEPAPCLAQGRPPQAIPGVGTWGASAGPLPTSHPNTLRPHPRAQTAGVQQDTPLTASPTSHVYARDAPSPALWVFELGINASRVGGILSTSVSNAMASLLQFERAIK